MDLTVNSFPAPCRANLKTIISNVNTDVETAYAMVLLTAALMDLCPADPKVAEIILDDCKGLRTVAKDE